jgi:hypothetical protein
MSDYTLETLIEILSRKGFPLSNKNMTEGTDAWQKAQVHGRRHRCMAEGTGTWRMAQVEMNSRSVKVEYHISHPNRA